MRPWTRSYQLFLDFCPWQLLAAPGSPWQPLAATKLIFCMIFGPGGRKIWAATKLIFCMRGFMDMLNSILILPKPQID